MASPPSTPLSLCLLFFVFFFSHASQVVKSLPHHHCLSNLSSFQFPRTHHAYITHARITHASRTHHARITHASRTHHARITHASRTHHARITHASRTHHARTTLSFEVARAFLFAVLAARAAPLVDGNALVMAPLDPLQCCSDKRRRVSIMFTWPHGKHWSEGKAKVTASRRARLQGGGGRQDIITGMYGLFSEYC